MQLRWAMRLPEAWRLLRISLRPNRILGIAVLSLGGCLVFGASVAAIGMMQRGSGAIIFDSSFFKNYAWSLFAYQAMLWGIFAPVLITGALTQEFNTGTWVFQQTTPQTTRALLLGKLIGASGDVYVASAVSLPILFITGLASPLSFGNIIEGFLFLVLISACMALLFCWTFCLFEKQPNSASSAFFAVPIFFGMQFLMLAGGRNSYVSAQAITPLAVLMHILGASSRYATIDFFAWRFSSGAFAFVLYTIGACMLFLILEGQLRRKMNIPMTRLPLFLVFGFIEFLILGLLWIFLSDKYVSLFSLSIFTVVSTIMLYFVLYTHARGSNDLRPWLYGRSSGKMTMLTYFRDDAPAAYTICGLLVIVITGQVILAYNVPFFRSKMQVIPLQAATLAIIVMRDTLFFQAMRLWFRRSGAFGMLIYCLVFLAPTGVAYPLMNGGKFMLDLTPAGALSPGIFAPNSQTDIYRLLSYLFLNSLLLLILAVINRRLMARIRHADPTPPPADLTPGKFETT